MTQQANYIKLISNYRELIEENYRFNQRWNEEDETKTVSLVLINTFTHQDQENRVRIYLVGVFVAGVDLYSALNPYQRAGEFCIT